MTEIRHQSSVRLPRRRLHRRSPWDPRSWSPRGCFRKRSLPAGDMASSFRLAGRWALVYVPSCLHLDSVYALEVLVAATVVTCAGDVRRTSGWELVSQ